MATTHPVEIKEVGGNMTFVPKSVTVARGDTVEWTNKMNFAHTVTGDDPALLGDSGEIAGGTTYSQVFNTAGTIAYHCEIHPFMTGTVIVT